MKRTRVQRQKERVTGNIVTFDVSTAAHPNVWAVVDLADWHKIKSRRWSATKRANGFYVRNGTLGLLHRYLISPRPEMTVDHIDGDPLNNSRSNLRECTQTVNMKAWHDKRRGYGVDIEKVVVPTLPHVVKVRNKAGEIKEYFYPARARTRTKNVIVRKKRPML